MEPSSDHEREIARRIDELARQGKLPLSAVADIAATSHGLDATSPWIALPSGQLTGRRESTPPNVIRPPGSRFDHGSSG